MAGPFLRIRKALTLAAPALCLVSPAYGSAGFDFGNIGQGVASIVIFFVLLAVLSRFAWKPLIAQLRRREEALGKQIQKAKVQQQEAQELLEQYRARMRKAEEDAKEVLARSHQEAVTARELLLTKTREEAKDAADAMRADIERAREDAIKDLHGAATRLAAEMATRVVEHSLSQEEQRRMVQRALEEIKRKGQEP